MRVLFLVTAYPRAPGDLITPWLVQTIHQLRERGVEVEVLAPAYRGSPSGVVEGVMVHRFRYAPAAFETLTHDQTTPDRIRERPLYAALVPGYVASATAAASRLARTGRFSVLHVFWPLPHGLIGLGAKRVSGVPLVCTFFGVELTWLRSDLPLLAPVLRSIVRGSDAVTAISTYTAAQLRAAAPAARPRIVPFGAAVSPPRAAPDVVDGVSSRDGPFEVLFVGRLVERKGVAILIDAIARLSDRANVRLRVVGEGPLRRDLENRAVRGGVADRVVFQGAVTDRELQHRFTHCDVFVLPAVVDGKGDTEGLGVVLIEALSYGKPVIASDVGGITDIIRHGETGLLVAAGDADALAASILRMKDDTELAARLAASGRKHVEDVFSWTAIIDSLIQLYKTLVSPRESEARQQLAGTHAQQ